MHPYILLSRILKFRNLSLDIAPGWTCLCATCAPVISELLIACPQPFMSLHTCQFFRPPASTATSSLPNPGATLESPRSARWLPLLPAPVSFPWSLCSTLLALCCLLWRKVPGSCLDLFSVGPVSSHVISSSKLTRLGSAPKYVSFALRFRHSVLYINTFPSSPTAAWTLEPGCRFESLCTSYQVCGLKQRLSILGSELPSPKGGQ